MDDPTLYAYPAAQNARSRGAHSSTRDLVAEANRWLAQHPARVEKAVQEERTMRLFNQLVGHLRVWDSRRRAESLGFEPSDVFWYDLALISNVLPGLFSDQYEMPTEERSEVRSMRDAAEGNNWPVLLGDVGAAFKRCSDWTKVTLFDAYAMGISVSTTEVDTALKEVRDQLGGSRPQGCPKECEECG